MFEWTDALTNLVIQVSVVGAAVGAIYKWFAKPWRKMASSIEKIEENQRCIVQITDDLSIVHKDLDVIKVKQENIEGITEDILRDRLMQCHDYHMRKGYCPQAEKMRFQELFASYKARGLNHLMENYEEEIMELPERDGHGCTQEEQ